MFRNELNLNRMLFFDMSVGWCYVDKDFFVLRRLRAIVDGRFYGETLEQSWLVYQDGLTPGWSWLEIAPQGLPNDVHTMKIDLCDRPYLLELYFSSKSPQEQEERRYAVFCVTNADGVFDRALRHYIDDWLIETIKR